MASLSLTRQHTPKRITSSRHFAYRLATKVKRRAAKMAYLEKYSPYNHNDLSNGPRTHILKARHGGWQPQWERVAICRSLGSHFWRMISKVDIWPPHVCTHMNIYPYIYPCMHKNHRGNTPLHYICEEFCGYVNRSRRSTLTVWHHSSMGWGPEVNKREKGS